MLFPVLCPVQWYDQRGILLKSVCWWGCGIFSGQHPAQARRHREEGPGAPFLGQVQVLQDWPTQRGILLPPIQPQQVLPILLILLLITENRECCSVRLLWIVILAMPRPSGCFSYFCCTPWAWVLNLVELSVTYSEGMEKLLGIFGCKLGWVLGWIDKMKRELLQYYSFL